jgi:GxxExxY protein
VLRILVGVPTDAQDPLTERIIGCAIEVHRILGPGLLESTYVEALTFELGAARLRVARQVVLPLTYKGRHLGEYRLDLLVEEAVVVEVKAVERFEPVHEAQLLTYLRLSGKRVGLLINFNQQLLRNGIRRRSLG